ncbi:MAG: transcription termination/antitermination protein NusG [Phycisphaerae bacterium]
MPILANEPMIYPADLLEQPVAAGLPTDGPCGESRWFVAHTKPRQEKALARYLFSRQIPYFAPQYVRGPVRPRGHAPSYLPLFAGYVFVKSDDAGRVEALQSNRIVAPLRVLDQVGLLNDLRRVKRLIDARLPLYPEERLAPGERVRIVSGPLAGMEGIVEYRVGRCRFVVSVDFIRQGVAVEVSATALEPAGLATDARREQPGGWRRVRNDDRVVV